MPIIIEQLVNKCFLRECETQTTETIMQINGCALIYASGTPYSGYGSIVRISDKCSPNLVPADRFEGFDQSRGIGLAGRI
jgi:hypothetical protein